MAAVINPAANGRANRKRHTWKRPDRRRKTGETFIIGNIGAIQTGSGFFCRELVPANLTASHTPPDGRPSPTDRPPRNPTAKTESPDRSSHRPARASGSPGSPDRRPQISKDVRPYLENTFFRMAEPVPTGSARIDFSSAAIILYRPSIALLVT